jgi:hypothetical protein
LDLSDDDFSADDESDSEDIEYLCLNQKNDTKEDEVVAVFLRVAKKVSHGSILHLLQGHASNHKMNLNDYSTRLTKEIQQQKTKALKPLSKPLKNSDGLKSQTIK